MILPREGSNGEKNKINSKFYLHKVDENGTIVFRNGLFSKGEYFNEG